ncbi:SIR2 family protein, partial [Mesonia mobilis]|uniref:SIR2 family protein n=1 Tax=Mesonia mobilis TaxID=369791 RepID=UPI0026EEDA6B
MKKNIFNNDISVIKEAINTDRLVIFAGAGISKDSGIPLWSELVKGIKGRLNEEINEKDSLKIAQMLYNEKGEKEYNDILTNLLFRNSISYNPIQELIFDLNPQHIVTTNFDMFFETIINDEGLPFSIVSRDSDLPYAKHKKMLIKYHGDFNNNNIVLKENDYLEFSKNHTLKEVFVKSLFSNKVILFVGYSVSDSNLKFLIREIQYILKKDYQKAYFLDIEEKRSNTEIKYFENLGVNVINIDNSNINFLEKKLNSSLSDKGNKLFYLLEYIRDFKLYQYRNLLDVNSTRTKIIKEYFNSIYRFKYFRILPLKTLANLYPINKDSNIDNPLYNIHNATLKIFDKDFYKLISDYTGDRDENFTDEENYQLKFILNRIYSSGILKLGRVDKPDNWGNYRIKEEIDLLDKIKSDFTCDCINCTLNSLNYSVGLNKIFKYNIDNKTELWDDLVYAYGLYQTKDFYKYFLALKSIITKSNKLEKLEVSFIAKYNLKRLKFSIINELQNKRLDFDDIENIEKEIDKINLDEELDKVKYFVDHDIFNFLKEIKDGAYLQRLCNKIDEIFLKVPQNVETIEKGGSHSDNAFQELYQNALKLHNFLNFNFLLGNRFSPIESTLKKSINTFILGYYLKKFVEPSKKSFFSISHIHSFDIFLFNLIINYGEDKELVK